MPERQRQTHRAPKRQFSEYYAPRPSLQSRLETESSNSRKPRIIAATVFVLLMLSMILLLSSFDPEKSQVRLSTSLYRPAAVYQSAVNDELQKLLNRSFATLDERRVGQSIRSSFPEVTSVRIAAKPFNRAVNVNITMNAPSFVLMSSEKSYIIDTTGTAIVERKKSSTSQLFTVNDKTGFNVQVGKKVFSSEDMVFIRHLLAGLQSSNIPVKAIELPPIAKQVRVYLDGAQYYIKFHSGGDARLQLGTLIALRERNVQPVEYIDVRVEGKAFIK